MAIQFKNGTEVMKRLKDVGYSSTRLRKEGILGEAYMTQIRNNGRVSMNALDTVCRLLNCQPADLIEYVPDEDLKIDL